MTTSIVMLPEKFLCFEVEVISKKINKSETSDGLQFLTLTSKCSGRIMEFSTCSGSPVVTKGIRDQLSGRAKNKE